MNDHALITTKLAFLTTLKINKIAEITTMANRAKYIAHSKFHKSSK